MEAVMEELEKKKLNRLQEVISEREAERTAYIQKRYNEYENPLTPSQTLEGKLIGHISIMYAEFKKIVDDLHIESEVPVLLEHMILAHHGKLEFGSPVLPCTREALLLSMIDLMDSKMMILDKAYDATKDGEWTEKLWMLDNMKFYKPKER